MLFVSQVTADVYSVDFNCPSERMKVICAPLLRSVSEPVILCSLLNLLWASLIAQLVKNLPAMQETSVQFLDGEDPMEKG